MTIHCWNEALHSNGPLPSGDTIYIRNNYVVHEVRREGDGYSVGDIDSILDMATFVKTQQATRRYTQFIPDEWIAYCVKGDIAEARMGPRWTMPFCYFGPEHKESFQSILGLDVGCNVLANSLRHHSDRFISRARALGEYKYEYEVFVPHHKHYQAMGCRMQGIDLFPCSTDLEVFQGDLRMLQYDDLLFDFITVAMIVGPSNPASSLLDAALCISELHRVIRPDGLVYIADFVITPAFVIMAMAYDFRVFTNNTYSQGIPVGIFLSKKGASRETRFLRIIRQLECNELLLNIRKPQAIENRELLRLDSLPPRVAGSQTRQ